MNTKNILLTLALLFVMPFSTDLNAKGGSSFSSSRSSSSSGFSSSRSSGSGGFSSSRSSGSGFSSSRSTTPSAPKSSGFSSGSGSSTPSKSWFGGSSSKPKNSFDHSSQRASLTPFKPKEQYVSEFKAQNANKYPTTFSTPPAQRPSYIPQTTVVNNIHYPITYNQSAGGYGFVNALGAFILYDAITDMAVHNYHRDEQAHIQAQQVTYNDYDNSDRSGYSILTFFGWFFGIIFLFILICVLLNL